jgi:orotidine-5'-phosphate decarboxylase
MTQSQLIAQIKKKQSFLCVGLDADLDKLPRHIAEGPEPLFHFCRKIIDATAPFAVAYKPNIAFFEAYGIEGWQALEKTISYLNTNYPEVFTIADAKRGDIGNTATRYAKAFFEQLAFDAITVAPYMGKDSVEPFLAFENNYTILLALTSNQGAQDFQYHTQDGERLFETVLQRSQSWSGAKERLFYVVGATQAEALTDIRKQVPDAFLLVPGVGAQGGSLDAVAHYGLNDQCGLLVNSSRGIIYASQGEDFESAAKDAAEELQLQMKKWLTKKGIV